jgi:hypothetical protein
VTVTVGVGVGVGVGVVNLSAHRLSRGNSTTFVHHDDVLTGAQGGETTRLRRGCRSVDDGALGAGADAQHMHTDLHPTMSHAASSGTPAKPRPLHPSTR